MVLRREPKESKGISHSHVPSDISLRVKALEPSSHKKLIDPEALDKWWTVTKSGGPSNGAKIVAKA